MPIRLEDGQEFLDQSLEAAGDLGEVAQEGAKRFWDGFSDFALQENVLQVAVGLIIAAAFTSVVTSFVADIMLPPISLLPFMNKNLDEKFAVLRRGPAYNYTNGLGYNTLEEAADDGAVVMAYGAFLNKVFSFFGVGLAMYLIASTYEWMSEDPIIVHTHKCTYCRKWINVKAQRCVNCTSWLDGREDKIKWVPAFMKPAAEEEE